MPPPVTQRHLHHPSRRRSSRPRATSTGSPPACAYHSFEPYTEHPTLMSDARSVHPHLRPLSVAHVNETRV